MRNSLRSLLHAASDGLLRCACDVTGAADFFWGKQGRSRCGINRKIMAKIVWHIGFTSNPRITAARSYLSMGYFGRVDGVSRGQLGRMVPSVYDTVDLLADHEITFASGLLNCFASQDVYFTSGVLNKSGLLQGMCDQRDRSPSDAEHVREKFLGQRHLVRSENVLRD